jgi:monoamine oxidase
MSELGLSLVNLYKKWPSGPPLLFFNNDSYPPAELKKDLNSAERNAADHLNEIAWPARWDHKSARTEYWDSWTVGQWLDAYCPGGRAGGPGKYLTQYFEVYYAGPIDSASAIHLIYDLAGQWGSGFDEKWTIAGGNDSLPTALASTLPEDAVQLGFALTALVRNTDGTYTCSFDSLSGPTEVAADQVLLALPFSVLRTVDYSAAGLSELRDLAIHELGMGLNCKLNFQFENRPWRPDFTGESISDLTTGMTWPGQTGLSGPQGILVAMNSSNWATQYGDHEPHGKASDDVVAAHLSAVDQLFPGATEHYIPGQGYLDYWPADPWVHGSYSYYPTGGFTTIAGAERGAEGGIHFAGEHTARYKVRGTMNGAVESGERAAKEILRTLRSAAPANFPLQSTENLT